MTGSSFTATVLALLAGLGTGAPSRAEPGVPPPDWVAQASRGLDPRALAALARISDTPRQLLALRAYLRAGDSLAQRWSWSQAQIAAYPNSPGGRTAAARLDAVIQAFAAANPGYALRANRTPRSLELQLAHWNSNASVARTAAALTDSLQRQFANGPVSAAQLRAALLQWQPGAAAALAAPGLSAHGQARAFDFQIEQRGRIIAGDDYASARQAWDAAGWTERLHTVMSGVGQGFTGPLQSPYEPWHYAYRADAPSSGS